MKGQFLPIALWAAAAVTQPALAQNGPNGPSYGNVYDPGYRDAFRDGYRAGYDDARAGRRYNDRAVMPPEPEQRPLPPGAYGAPPPPSPAYSDRNDIWRRRYAEPHTYNDDLFYRECRNTSDPAGILTGSIIGGLAGNAVGRGNGQMPTPGIILSGTPGVALTEGLDCNDRSYVYRAYYDGLNANRANSTYGWRNPRNGRYGDFYIGEYYTDDDGFFCATYSQRLSIDGASFTVNGHTCQQPDGHWTFVVANP